MSPVTARRRSPLLRSGRTLFSLALLAWSAGGLCAARWDDPGLGLPWVRCYTARDTGSLSPSHCALATRDGLLLLGQDGLLCFDGESWRPLPVPEGHAVRCLAEDDAGRVWVGGDGLLGYLTFAPEGGASFTSALERLPPEQRALGEVGAVFALPQNTVVAVTENRVLRLRASGAQVWSLPAPRRLSAWRDSDGAVVIAQPDSATLRLGEVGLEPAAFPEPFARAGIEWCVRFPDGSSLASAGGRLVGNHSGRWAPLEGAAASLLAQDRSSGAVVLPGGFAVIATRSHGLLILDSAGNTISALDQDGGLPSNRIAHLAIGMDSSLAVTTQEGVSVLCGGRCASFFDTRNGLHHRRLPAIARGASGLFAAGDAATYRLASPPAGDASPAGQWCPQPGAPPALRQLFPLAGRLLGVGGAGLCVVDEAGGPPALLRPGDIAAATAWSGQDGGLAWVEGTRFLRGRLSEGILLPTTQALELDTEVVNLVEDSAGAHWLGTRQSGVLRIAPAQAGGGSPALRRYRDNLRPAPGSPLRVLRVGNRILATIEGGLALYSEEVDGFIPCPGIANARIHALSAPEPDGTVWMAVSQRDRYPFQVRIARLQPEGSGVSCELVQLPALPPGEEPTALFAEPGPAPGSRVFWLGLPGRIERVESSGALASKPPITPAIAALTVIDQDLAGLDLDRSPGAAPGRRQGCIDFDNTGVRLDVSVPQGRLAQRVHLECRMPELDAAWVPLGEIPSRLFRGLRDGTYHFEARTVDALGRPSPAASREFVVLPPWWRCGPAYTGYALGLVLVCALVFLTRLKLARAHRGQLEELVAQRTRELAAANAAKSDFLAHINHEIRNPLNGVVGLSEMLANRNHDEGSRQLARALKSCAGYLGSVVDNVLDLARIEAGRAELCAQRFEPRLLIEDIAEMFRMQIEETGGHVACSADPELPRLLVGDVHRIRQVLVNYTANAARYARGGQVRLSVRRRTQTATTVEAVFTVADTGPGITPEEQARIFEKFARGHAAAGAPRGYGVGLALVRDLAELMGGQADVDSAPGRGAKFRLTVPLELAVPENQAPPAAPQPRPAALRVLVIDDQAFNRLVLRDHLERLGCHVEEAGDGTSAHLLLQARAHHLAFVDLDLPGLDGLALMGRVRRECGEPGVFLVATTASATSGIEQTVRAAGAHAFLPKPIALARLAALLEECAARPAALGPNAALRQPAPAPAAPDAGICPGVPATSAPAATPAQIPPAHTAAAAALLTHPTGHYLQPAPASVPLQRPSTRQTATAATPPAPRHSGLPATLPPPTPHPEAPLPATGLFAELSLTTEMLRLLHSELDAETQALTENWRQGNAPAARRQAHRIASLGIIARDDVLLQAARRAEEALQPERAGQPLESASGGLPSRPAGGHTSLASPEHVQAAIDELERAARDRLSQLAAPVNAAAD